ncbi:hypothetical protein AMECASPLE_024523, partial [Ameca splendens]
EGGGAWRTTHSESSSIKPPVFFFYSDLRHSCAELILRSITTDRLGGGERSEQTTSSCFLRAAFTEQENCFPDSSNIKTQSAPHRLPCPQQLTAERGPRDAVRVSTVHV